MLHFALALIAALGLTFDSPAPVYDCPSNGGQIALSVGGVKLFDLTTGEATLLVDPGDSLIDRITWSPDGTRLAFMTNRGGSWGIYGVDVSESGEALGKPTPLADAPEVDESSPVWSPDSTQIAYTVNGHGAVISADGGEPRILTAAPAYDVLLWMGDGKHILYATNDEGEWNVEQVAVDTDEITAIASGEGYAVPYSLSPDGALLLAVESDGNWRVVMVDTVSGTVTDSGIPGDVPAWSPDGTQYVYQAWVEALGRYEVILIGADGSRTILTEDFTPDVLGKIVWSPDGTRLAFTAYGMDYANSNVLHMLTIDSRTVQAYKQMPVSDVSPEWRPCAV